MTELALAAFAAASDAHHVDAPRSARYERFAARFDARSYLADLAGRGLRWVGRSDPRFPPLLRAIHDPPPGLFVRGNGDVELLSGRGVAIVGARACSPYGSSVARSLGRDLAAAGLAVISGLARGIDAEAHRGALDAGGVTVAALGCGIDRDYPAAHADLARRIGERGLIVSEYAPGVEPAPWRFPARKRRGRAAMPFPLNHAVRTCRRRRRTPCPCGPGVVSGWWCVDARPRLTTLSRVAHHRRHARRGAPGPMDNGQASGPSRAVDAGKVFTDRRTTRDAGPSRRQMRTAR